MAVFAVIVPVATVGGPQQVTADLRSSWRAFTGDSTKTAHAGSTGLQSREEVRNGKGGTSNPQRCVP